MLFSRIIFIAVSPSVILLDVKSFMISVFSYFVVEKVINIKLGFLKMFLRVLLNCTIIGSLKYKKVKKNCFKVYFKRDLLVDFIACHVISMWILFGM